MAETPAPREGGSQGVYAQEWNTLRAPGSRAGPHPSADINTRSRPACPTLQQTGGPTDDRLKPRATEHSGTPAPED
ncbi:unnamed protein product [Gadus morhua 'NCC']